MVMFVMLTGFPLAAVFVAKVAVPLTVKTSPDTRSSLYTAVALTVASYTFESATAVTVRVRTVTLAVVVVLVFCV